MIWKDEDYDTAKYQMLHEAEMMQNHPSMLAFLVGSDFWPDDRATDVYVNALNQMNWQNPVIAAAAKRSYPERLGPSGMKMDGPVSQSGRSLLINICQHRRLLADKATV